MTGSTLIISLLGAAGVVLAAFPYLSAEPAGSARALLLGFRVVSISIVTLLLVNPAIPGIDPSRPALSGGKWILVDPDLSLEVPGEGGEPLWGQMLDSASAGVLQGARLAAAVSGDGGPVGVGLEELAARSPSVPRTNLRAAVSGLGEAGADSIVLLSTMRRSIDEIATLEAEAPIPVRLARLGAVTRNIGIGELSLSAAESGTEELSGRVGLFGEGGAEGDSVRVELRADGALVQILYAAMPRSGEELSVPLTLPPPPDTGLVRYTARGVLPGDVFPADDVRARWVISGRPDRGILLLSLRPDWEPRVLLPVLEAVTGLEGRGYLKLGDDRYLPLVGDGDPVRPVTAEAFQEGISEAEILVIHGSIESPPTWLVEAAQSHPRVLHLPDPEGATLTGLDLLPVLAGEWVPAVDLPASPLSPFLAGISLGGLPPLAELLPVAGPFSGTPGLNAQGSRDGEPMPVLVLVEEGRGRRVVALADGFWRWGVRDGEARRAYRAMWGGVTAWLLGYSAVGVGDFVRPEALLQRRGEPLRWEVAPQSAGWELSLTWIHDGGDGPREASGDVAADPRFSGTLQPGDDGVAVTPPVEPGIYRFDVRDPGLSPDESIAGSGIVEVERWAPSLRLPPLELSGERLGASGGSPGLAAAEGRPLRTHPLPYAILLVLLGAEWVGRRRVGLR